MYQGRSIPLSRASRCHQERAWPVMSATSMARAARWRPPPGNLGSSRPAHRARSPASSESDHWRSCSRRAGSKGGSRNSPSARARTYRPVPPTTTTWRATPVARASVIHAAASRANRPALYDSPGVTRSSPRCGTRARVARSGLAVPISRPRYTWRASAEMTVIGVRAASATATAVLPTPVGPTMTGVRCRVSGGAAKTPFQLFLWQLDHRGPAMHIVRRECGRQQPDDELAHLVAIECLAGLDRGPAGVRGGKTLEPILPAAEPAAGEIGDQLLQAARRFEPGMRIWRRMHHDAPAGERLDLVPDAREQR